MEKGIIEPENILCCHTEKSIQVLCHSSNSCTLTLVLFLYQGHIENSKLHALLTDLQQRKMIELLNKGTQRREGENEK
jgi:hypothetical protein